MTRQLYALDLGSGKLTTLDLPENVYTAHRDLETDSVYLASAARDVLALFSGTGRAEGTWSKRISMPKYETFAWLDVESDFTDADGSLAPVVLTFETETGERLYQVEVSARGPLRLPAWRHREIILTVRSAARITAVKLASTTAELKAV